MDDEKTRCELIELYRFLGKKWTVELLHNIELKPVSFNDLKRISRNLISPILLSNRLKHMVKFKIIKRYSINNKISYVITNRGIGLRSIMHDLKKWSIESDYRLPAVCKENKCLCNEIFNRR